MPVFTLGDFAIILLGLSLLKINLLKKYKRGYLFSIGLMSCLFIFNLLLHSSLISIFGALRLYGSLVVLCLLVGRIDLEFSNITDKKHLLNKLAVLKKLTPYLLLIVGLQIGIGTLQVYKGSDLGLQFLGETEIVLGRIGSSFIDTGTDLIMRAYGTFQHPNLLAGFLILCSIYFYFLHRFNSLNVKPLLIIQAFLMYGISITFARTALFLFILNFLIYFWPNILKTVKRLLKFPKSHFALFPIYWLDRIRSLFADSAYFERKELLKGAIELIKSNLLTGVGIGEYVRAAIKYPVSNSAGILLLQPVHNLFYLTIAEQGSLAGGALLIWLSLGLFNYLLEAKDKRISLMVIITIALIGSVDHYLISLPAGQLILLTLLVIAALSPMFETALAKSPLKIQPA
ncbi:MAG: hypothetical protein Fur003_0530 [Candidatus Dojkabacteria bacterium]